MRFALSFPFLYLKREKPALLYYYTILFLKSTAFERKFFVILFLFCFFARLFPLKHEFHRVLVRYTAAGFACENRPVFAFAGFG